MTFLPKNITPIKVDVLRINAQSTSPVPITMNLSGSLNNTRATFDSSTYQITLPEGSHWRLVFQCGQYTFASNAPSTSQHVAGIYSVTDGDYLGQEGILTPWNSGIKGRASASCLILNSEITTQKVIECRYKTLGSGAFARTNSAYAVYHYHGVVIMELPA